MTSITYANIEKLCRSRADLQRIIALDNDVPFLVPTTKIMLQRN